MSDMFGIPIHISGDGQDGPTTPTSTEHVIDQKPGDPVTGTNKRVMPDFNPGRQYHRTGNQSYAFQNSLPGLQYAAAHKFKSVDGDYWLSADRIPMNCHDNLPCRKFAGQRHRGGFTGAPESYQISKHNAADTAKLHNGDLYIRDASVRFKQAASLGLHYQMEVKGNTDQWTAEVFHQVMQQALAANCLVMIKCLDNVDGYQAVLDRARKAGFQTRIIHAADL